MKEVTAAIILMDNRVLTIKLMAFWCKWISGDFTLKVHSQIAWVNHVELDLYDFAPADIPLMEKLKSVMS